MTAVSAACVVVSVASQRDGVVARVNMTGEIDLAVEASLAATVFEIGALAPSAVLIDLTDVTFADTSLVNFLIPVRDVIPDTATMRTIGAISLVRRVLTVTGVDELVGLDDALAATERQPPAPLKVNRHHR